MVRGPENTPYEGGYYHGKLVFPREFPFKPPSIYIITPNGRFKTNIKLCLSISDFHPDTWNPAWSVSTILTGLLSFMVNFDLSSFCQIRLIFFIVSVGEEQHVWQYRNHRLRQTSLCLSIAGIQFKR